MKTNTAWVSECEAAHGANWRRWLGHLKDTPANGLELGTWMGESAEWMLDNIFTHPESHYLCVDWFEGSEEHHLAGIDCSTILEDTLERLNRFGRRKTVLKCLSHNALHDYGGPPLDFVYVDAAHDAMNVLRDSVLAFDLLKVGGVMIFDDYEWGVMPQQVDRPKMAVDAFLECYARHTEVIGLGYQAAIRRTS